MVKYILIFILIAFTGCKSTKDVQRQDEDRTLTETSKTITTRIGDTVRYEIPKVVLRDTTIFKKNYVTGTTQVVRYNNDGKITWVECQSGMIEIMQENNRILIENINNMQKHKETEIPASTFIYFFIGLALFLVIVLGVAFLFLKKYLKTVIPI